jgi:hypothetical protein
LDSTAGQAVPSEVLGSGDNYQHIRFQAQDVPAVGYKVFQVRAGATSPTYPETKQTTLESPYYKVALDAETGAVRSTYDKQLHRELVDVEDLDKTSILKREAAYFAFPFAMEQPQFHYEIQTGVVDPATDMYPGAGLEWFSVQHWVSAQQDRVS